MSCRSPSPVILREVAESIRIQVGVRGYCDYAQYDRGLACFDGRPLTNHLNDSVLPGEIVLDIHYTMPYHNA